VTELLSLRALQQGLRDVIQGRSVGRVDEVLTSIVDDVSPFHFDLRSQFLAVAAQHPDRLVAALAEFEEAAFANPSKSTAELIATINWTCDPYPVLSRLVESES
jgi:hypothetical protein